MCLIHITEYDSNLILTTCVMWLINSSSAYHYYYKKAKWVSKVCISHSCPNRTPTTFFLISHFPNLWADNLKWWKKYSMRSSMTNHQPVRKEVTNILKLCIGHTTVISFSVYYLVPFSGRKEFSLQGWSAKSGILLIHLP